MVIYGDLVAILNFCVDFLLLMGAGRLTGLPPRPGRCAMASALGAGYAFACLLPQFFFLGGLFFRTVSLFAMAFLCFGLKQGSMKRALVFVLLSFALGGAAVLLQEADFFAPVAGAAVVWGLCRVGLGDRIGGRRLLPLEVENGTQRVLLTALHDTGNGLRDTVTGSAVIVVDAAAAKTLTGLTTQQLRRPADTLMSCPGSKYRLVPYRTVGCPGGMLLAKKLRVKEGHLWKNRLVAFSPEKLGDDFQALTGGNENG